MKILFLNSDDSGGGAAIAALRLHESLIKQGVQSRFLVHRRSPRLAYRWRVELDRVLLKKYPHREAVGFTSAWVPHSLKREIKSFEPDLIHIHFIDGGFFRLEEMSRWNLPLVWTLHDMWAFTGGCHYTSDCQKFVDRCGACPVLGSKKDNDLSSWNFRRKEEIYQKLSLRAVAPSRWMRDVAQSSHLFKDIPIEQIPNSIDSAKFRPGPKKELREKWKLPLEKSIIFLNAFERPGNKRKGTPLFEDALLRLEKSYQDKVEILCVGSVQLSEKINSLFKVHSFGVLNDSSKIAELCASSDFFAAPSIQDNLPNTVLEAMACGIPTVAFRIGGMSDLIEDGVSGTLAEPGSGEDFSKGLQTLIKSPDLCLKLGQNARKKAENDFDPKKISERHFHLYQDILSGGPRRHFPRSDSKPSLIILAEKISGGGVGRVAAELASRWASDGFQVHLIYFDKSLTAPDYSVDPRVKLHRVPDERKMVGGWLRQGKLVRDILKKLSFKMDGDRTLISFLPHMSVYGRLSSFGLGLRVIATEHLYPKFEFHYQNIFKRFMVYLSYLFSDAVVVLTSRSRECFPKILSSKIKVIPNLNPKIKNDESNPQMEIGPYILSVGRLCSQKRFDLLIDAFREACRHYPDWKLLIAGDGILREKLGDQVRQLGLSGKVEFLGFVKDLNPYYQSCRFLAMASDFEGWSLVSVEAMQYGKPVIHTDCPAGPREIIEPNETGILVPVGDRAALSQALLKLMNDPQLVETMGRKAKEGVKRFNWENISPVWKDVLQ